MAASSYDEALSRLLVHEGGNDDDPRDPGGRTSRGILQREWDKWRQTHPGLPSDVWEAPQDQVVAIYRQKYWDALRCDELPPGVDYAVFDYGVNSGIGRSSKVLQGIVGVTQDGEIGPNTLAAVASSNPKDLVARICDERLSFLQGLKTWPTFGRGWARRVAEVRAVALEMASHAPAVPPSSRVAVEPPWMVKARSYIGFHEVADNRGIEEFIEGAHTGSLGDPWCAIFANFSLETVGVPGTRSAMARSFESNANFVRLAKPILGCVVTMWRNSISSGSGHVGFFVKQDAKNVYLLDGNANDEVGIHPHPADRITGYWWPKSVPQTVSEPIMTEPQPSVPAPAGKQIDWGKVEQWGERLERLGATLDRFAEAAQGKAQPSAPTTADPAPAKPTIMGLLGQSALVKVLPMLGIQGGILGLVTTAISVATGVAGAVTTSPTTGSATSIFGGMLASGLLGKLLGKKSSTPLTTKMT